MPKAELADSLQPREQFAARFAVNNPHAYILQPVRIADARQLPSRNVRHVGAEFPTHHAYQQLPVSLQPSRQTLLQTSRQTSRLAFGNIRVAQRLEALLQCRPQPLALFDPFQHHSVLQKIQVRPGPHRRRPEPAQEHVRELLPLGGRGAAWLANFPQPREEFAARVAIDDPHANILQPIRIANPCQRPGHKVRHVGAEFPTHHAYQQLPVSLQPSLFGFGNIRVAQRLEALLQCRPQPPALLDPFQHHSVLQKLQVRPGPRRRQPEPAQKRVPEILPLPRRQAAQLADFLQPCEEVATRVAIDDPFANIL